MPRDPQGNYSLAPGNPVAPGEIIQSAWANNTMNDIAAALTDSLDREGRGSMNAPFQFDDGTQAAPGATWGNEPSTGFYRAFLGDLRVTVLGTDVFRWLDGDVQIWDGVAWNSVVYAGGPGGMPPGNTDGQTIVWNNNTQAWQPDSTLIVNYNNTDVQMLRDLSVGRNIDLLGNITLQGNVDGRNVSQDGNALDNHLIDNLIHFDDVGNDGVQYVRRNRAWEPVAAIGEVIPPGTADGQTLRWETTGPSWVNTSDLLVQDDGDVIIGANMLVNGTFIGATSFTFDGEGATTTGIFTVSGGNLVNRGANHIWEDNLGAEFMRIQTDGDVGIGRNPAGGAKLDVDGDIYTEGLPLITGAKRLEVRATLPGSPENDVIYFLTG